MTGAGAPEATATAGPDYLGRLVVGYVSEEPFSFVDESDRLTGFDVAVVEEFARRRGVKALAWEEVLWGEVEGVLSAGRVHMNVTGLAWNEARAAAGVPSAPLYTVVSMGFVPKGNPDRIRSIDDMAAKAYRVGAIPGGLEYRVLRERLGERAAGYPSERELWPALDRCEIGAAVFAEYAGRSYLARHPEASFEPAPGFEFPILPETMYFFRKGETRLKAAFDAHIREIKRDGTLAQILERFGYPVECIVPAAAPPP
ncbi:MAG: substrate-binding periplasmic protein [Alphaproteobacteria bacterium]